jgi:hypothetical protein
MWGGVRRFPPRERQRGCGTADARPRCHRTFGEQSTGAGPVAGLSSPGSVTFKDMNTLRIVTPTLSPGPQSSFSSVPMANPWLSMQLFSRNNYLTIP